MAPTTSSMRPSTPVPVDDLAAGMRLAEDVHDAQGRLLIPAGAELTDRHLRAFQLWGISAVRVQGGGETEPAVVISPELLAAVEADIRARLARNDLASPVVRELYRVLVEREAFRRAGGGRG